MPSDAAKLLDDLRRGEFHIDCVWMELVRISDGKKYEGPGYVRQNPIRDFEIKIYSAATVDFREVFQALASNNAGKLYGDADYFALSATDDGHRKWKAERIINPSSSGHVAHGGIVVTADCQEVVLLEDRFSEEKTSMLRFEFFEAFKFPRTAHTERTIKVGVSRKMSESSLNVAEIASNSLKFCFEEEDGVSVRVAGEQPTLHPQLETRVVEAITFAFGIIPMWSLLYRSEDAKKFTRCRSNRKAGRNKTQWPPFAITSLHEPASTWEIFDKYLTYVLADAVAETHSLSLEVFGVAQTRDATVEGQALSVAVAVESVLEKFFHTTGLPGAEQVATVDRLFDYLDKWDGDKTIIARAKGSLGGLKMARPDDRLRKLVSNGIVSDAGYRAWKKLRNTAAHGNWHVYDGKLQELLDLVKKVTGLFNQLVFHLIDYTGKQTDYGTHGWPTIDYPPAVAKDLDIGPAEAQRRPRVQTRRLDSTRLLSRDWLFLLMLADCVDGPVERMPCSEDRLISRIVSEPDKRRGEEPVERQAGFCYSAAWHARPVLQEKCARKWFCQMMGIP